MKRRAILVASWVIADRPRPATAATIAITMIAAVAAVAGRGGSEPTQTQWRTAQPGWQYEFPRDHHAHPEFKTEWWYFTGNLFDERGRRFGYELTFFRQGIIPPAERSPERSRFVVNDLKFAHFTVTDGHGRQFHFDEKASRGAFADAGFDRGENLAWIDDWSVRMNTEGEIQLFAKSAAMALNVALVPAKPPVIHGENGVSMKAAGEGHASHYYSITRIASRGTLQLGGKSFAVDGTSWFDHEWATNQLAPQQLGWNWLCIQFADDSDLMLYQMRRDDGSFDAASSGTFVAADESATHLRAEDFSMTSNATWKSKQTGSVYPVRWRVQVPSRGIDITVQPVLDDQELAFVPVTYWEGAVDISGSGKGVGYLELTGYAGRLSALNR
jgi:predicted secreted hydrolase